MYQNQTDDKIYVSSRHDIRRFGRCPKKQIQVEPTVSGKMTIYIYIYIKTFSAFRTGSCSLITSLQLLKHFREHDTKHQSQWGHIWGSKELKNLIIRCHIWTPGHALSIFKNQKSAQSSVLSEKNNSCIKSHQRNKEIMDSTINETMKPNTVQCFSLFWNSNSLYISAQGKQHSHYVFVEHHVNFILE